MLSQKKHLSLCYPSTFRACRSVLTLMACLILLAGRSAGAQETFAQPARLITTFPFTLFTGGGILIKARLNNFSGSLNFILDTGSGGILLDLLTCLRLRLTPKPSHPAIFGIARIRQGKVFFN